MQLFLNRFFKGADYTVGHLSIDGIVFCDTIEDVVRVLGVNGEGKIPDKTAIPAGTYKITLAYSPKFKRIMPLLLNVPFFQGILIHTGNTQDDSSGCIIVGENKVKGKVINSQITFNKLYPILKKAYDNRETIQITII